VSDSAGVSHQHCQNAPDKWCVRLDRRKDPRRPRPSAGAIGRTEAHVAGMGWFWKALGGKQSRDQKRSVSLVARAAELEPELKGLSDAELADRARANRDDAPELLACLREVAERATGLRPFDVQLQGALRLLEGDVVQMATGEGKTLSGALA